MGGRDAKVERLERQLHRMRTSPSLRLGAHVTNAMRRPWLAPFLPLTLPWKMFTIGLEMLGRRPGPEPYRRGIADANLPARNCVVMFPTNGVGFGHFTRMLSVATRMKKEDPSLEIIFFTTMPTLHLLKPHGIAAHHISGPKYFHEMSTRDWNGLLEQELSVCFEVHRPKQFIFDGAFPYRGMLNAIAGEEMDKVWMRRGTFRRGSTIPVDSIGQFDLIVHPKDSVPLATSEVEHEVPVEMCPPIVLLDPEERMGRAAARRRLGIPTEGVCVYVQLGAGEINDIDSEVRMTVEALRARDVHVVLGESMIGERIDVDLDGVRIIRDYPNSVYFDAFDATIQAGGYNSFHETRLAGLPVLFYPNMYTGMDDQLARCMVAESEGWGKVLKIRERDSIIEAVNDLLDRVGSVEAPEEESGAWPLARMLLTR